MLRFTTNQGYEDIVVNEVHSILAREGVEVGSFEGSPFGIRGNVLYRHTGDDEELTGLIPGMRSIYHCVRYLAHTEFESEDFFSELDSFFAELPVPRLEQASSFRVRCERRGSHPFHSPDVERKVGGILQGRYGTAVNLEEPDCDFRIDTFDRHLFAGIRLTTSRRDRRFD
mgnify:FL=1